MRRILALVALVAMLVLPPFALLAWGFTDWSSISLWTPADLRLLLGALTVIGWVVWAAWSASVLVELLALGLTCGLAAAFLKPDRVRLKLALACVAHAGAMFGTCLVSGVAVIAMRGAAGVFAGLMLWAAISTITRAERPERLSGVFVTVQTLAQLVLAAVLPATVVPLPFYRRTQQTGA